MLQILKRLLGFTPSVDEIVAPLARITANLEAAMVAHKLKVEAHDIKIKALKLETDLLNAAHAKADAIRDKLNTLLGN